jgi:hypothetical protein
MLDPYALEETLKMERAMLSQRRERRAIWPERSPRRTPAGIISLRRSLARALLALADRLDPRAAVLGPHAPARPALNGTLHRA